MIADVTVVVAALPERTELLARALASVAGQTMAPREVRVRMASTGQDAGRVRNQLLRDVTTTWVAFLDDDDELLPRHLEACLGATAGADLVYPWCEVVGRSDPFAVLQDGQLVSPLGVPFGLEQERHLRRVGNFIPVTHLVRASFLKKVNGFPSATRECPEDYGLLLRLLDKGAQFRHVPEVTWRYHFHGNNTGGQR